MSKTLWKRVQSWTCSNERHHQIADKPLLEMNQVNSIKNSCTKLAQNLQSKWKSPKEQQQEQTRNKVSVTLTLIPLLITIITGPLVPLCHCSSVHRRASHNHRSLQEWDDIFHSRSDEDWRMLWHKEKHRRCQHQLVSHMELVCDKDIYKLARKRRKRNANEQEVEDYADYVRDSDPTIPLFTTFDEANQFGRQQLLKISGRKNRNREHSKRSGLTGNRINKRGISDECCHGPDGCSWEEYAEYCPANVRVRSVAN